jgi:hypothetical protein
VGELRGKRKGAFGRLSTGGRFGNWCLDKELVSLRKIAERCAMPKLPHVQVLPTLQGFMKTLEKSQTPQPLRIMLYTPTPLPIQKGFLEAALQVHRG